MKVESAISIATEWVMHNASQEKFFQGAYFSGSTVGMSNDAELPPSSDVDIVIVTALDEPPLKLGKLVYRGTLLEVTYLSWNQLSSAKEVLKCYYLAGSFRVDTIITDPTGRLRRLQSQVSQHFNEKVWVRRRCENARAKIENGIRNIDATAPFYDLVTSWLFPASLATHVFLVAALRNPTVRLRYIAAREVLVEYGHSDIYTELLELIGCAQLTPSLIEEHLAQLARTFDATVAVSKTPFFFSSDITAAARPIAIDGSRELIRSGNHREAVFWIVATFARCHKILAADAPLDLQLALTPAFEDMVADLGITSADDFIHRTEDVIQFLPTLWETTEDILSKNPGIVTK